jgi:hypothetical protein
MQQLSRFEVRGTTKFEALVADLRKRATLTSADIENEEARTGIFDATIRPIPCSRGRRGNLPETIATSNASWSIPSRTRRDRLRRRNQAKFQGRGIPRHAGLCVRATNELRPWGSHFA